MLFMLLVFVFLAWHHTGWWTDSVLGQCHQRMKLQGVKTQEALIWIVPTTKVSKPVLYLLLQHTCPRQQHIIGTLLLLNIITRPDEIFFVERTIESIEVLSTYNYTCTSVFISSQNHKCFSFEVVLCWSAEMDAVRCKICSEWRMVKMLPAVWWTYVCSCWLLGILSFWTTEHLKENTYDLMRWLVRCGSVWCRWSLMPSQLDVHILCVTCTNGQTVLLIVDCMEKLRTCAWNFVLWKIHVYVINRTVVYCLRTEHTV